MDDKSTERHSDGPPSRVLLATLGGSLTQSIRRAVQSIGGLKFIGHVTGYSEIVRTVDGMSPDVILVDIQYLRDDGIDMLDRLRQQVPGLVVLLVGKLADVTEAERIIHHGASGIVDRSASLQQFLTAIDKVRAGEIWLPRAWMSRILRRNHGSDRQITNSGLHSRLDDLSVREAEIAQYISRGLSNKQIAAELEISENTVRAHVSNIFKKLHIKRRIDLIVR